MLIIGARIVDGVAELAMPGPPPPWPGSSDFSGFRLKVGAEFTVDSCGDLDIGDSPSAWDLLRAAQAADRDPTYWVDPATDQIVGAACR